MRQPPLCVTAGHRFPYKGTGGPDGHAPKETATTRERKDFSSSSPAEEDTTAESALAAPQALFAWL